MVLKDVLKKQIKKEIEKKESKKKVTIKRKGNAASINLSRYWDYL